MEPDEAHDDVAQQLIDSIGLDCAIIALSRLCDRSAGFAESIDHRCLAFVYRSIATDLRRAGSLMRSNELIDRFRATEESHRAHH